MNNYYITTTLPYVNAKPHIGHTLEFIQADVIARFKRSKLGDGHVWFNVGADEHGLKIFEKAREAGMEPKAFVDQISGQLLDFCDLFSIKYDSFYRTSEPYHIKPAQEFWKKSEEAGDIYKKLYTGKYCVGCEEFKTDKDLVDGCCPLHGTEPIDYEEENYFFKMSNYRQPLLDWLDANPEAVKPHTAWVELRQWIVEMEDISISRQKESLPWGVPVPGDKDQVMYVWFDALTNYVNILGYGTDEERLNAWWPGVQVFGPDNLRFQGAIFQSMLASAGLPQTKTLLRHGMILAEDGTKMSKTKGNVVDPFELAEKFDVETIRFYIIAGITTLGDSAFKESDLINLYNAHLANNFGNLLNRVLHLANSKEVNITNESLVEAAFKEKVDTLTSEVNEAFESYRLQDAALKINELSTFGNEYITENEPWSKDIDESRRQIILTNLRYLLLHVARLYEPIIPLKSKQAQEMLEEGKSGVLFEKILT